MIMIYYDLYRDRVVLTLEQLRLSVGQCLVPVHFFRF